jgi:hypothetical protein
MRGGASTPHCGVCGVCGVDGRRGQGVARARSRPPATCRLRMSAPPPFGRLSPAGGLTGCIRVAPLLHPAPDLRLSKRHATQGHVPALAMPPTLEGR